MNLAKKTKRIIVLVSIPVFAVSVIFVIMGINTLKLRNYLRTVCTEQTNGIVYDFIVTGSEINDANGYHDLRPKLISPLSVFTD